MHSWERLNCYSYRHLKQSTTTPTHIAAVSPAASSMPCPLLIATHTFILVALLTLVCCCSPTNRFPWLRLCRPSVSSGHAVLCAYCRWKTGTVTYCTSPSSSAPHIHACLSQRLSCLHQSRPHYLAHLLRYWYPMCAEQKWLLWYGVPLQLRCAVAEDELEAQPFLHSLQRFHGRCHTTAVYR